MQPTLAPIVDQVPGLIHFRVDEVTPAADRLPTAQVGEILQGMLGGDLLACSHSAETRLVAGKLVDQVGIQQPINPLIAAVDRAFNQHRPLALGPDVIWLTIGQGFSQHINLHHERWHDRLVRHSGRKPLVIERRLDEGWEQAVAKWSAAIADEVGAGLGRLLTCDFSTTTPAIRAASQIVLMESLRRYFDYREMAICGIPSVRLYGTPTDWRTIRERIELLAEYDLGHWVERLRPIADGLCASAEGRPDLRFWQEIYKPVNAYGGDVVTGWIADLFPYLNHYVSHTPSQPNPLLQKPRAAITARDGLVPSSFPAGLAQVHIHRTEGKRTTTHLLAGGLIGVIQADNGTLSPEIGWAVRASDPFTAWLDQLAAHSERADPIDWRKIRGIPELEKEAIQILDTFHGQTLFGVTAHPWKVREPDQLDRVTLLETGGSFVPLFDLADGRSVGWYRGTTWSGVHAEGTLRSRTAQGVAVGRPTARMDRHDSEPRPYLTVADTMIIASSLAQLIDRLLAVGGDYYFDAPGFLPDTPLLLPGERR